MTTLLDTQWTILHRLTIVNFSTSRAIELYGPKASLSLEGLKALGLVQTFVTCGVTIWELTDKGRDTQAEHEAAKDSSRSNITNGTTQPSVKSEPHVSVTSIPMALSNTNPRFLLPAFCPLSPNDYDYRAEYDTSEYLPCDMEYHLTPAQQKAALDFARCFRLAAATKQVMLLRASIAIKMVTPEPCDPAPLTYQKATWKSSAAMPTTKLPGYAEAVQTLKAEQNARKQAEKLKRQAKLTAVRRRFEAVPMVGI